MKKILFSIFLLVFVINVNADEIKYFDINIPDTYTMEETKENVYKWVSNDNKYENIVITIEKNDGQKNNISRYTDKNIEQYKEYIQAAYNKALEEYNLKIDVKSIKKEKVNNVDALVYDIVWPTKDSIGYDTYQKGITWTTKNYIYMYLWSSDKEIDTNNDNYKKILKSFKMNDELIKPEGFFNTRRKRIIIVGTLAGITGYIISALQKRKKKNV